jgi:hypothetical protein
MKPLEIKLSVTVQLDEKWASNLTTEELVECLKAQLDKSLGFRGQITKLKLVSK